MAKTTIELAQAGEYWGHWQGGYELTVEDLNRMVQNFSGDVVIDYEHQSLMGEGAAPAAGWITEIFVEDESLYGRVTWNESAETMIDADEYRFISPVFDLYATDPATDNPIGAKLINAGLTNNPFMEGMETVTDNSSTGGLSRLMGVSREHVLNSRSRIHSATSGADGSSEPGPASDSSQPTSGIMDWEAKFNAFLNRIGVTLNTNGNDELDVLDEARQLKAKAEEADELRETLNSVKKEKEELAEKVAELEAAQAEQVTAEHERVVDEAIANFKIPKARRDQYLKNMANAPEETKEMLDDMPEGAHKPSGPEKPDSDAGTVLNTSTSGNAMLAYVKSQTG